MKAQTAKASKAVRFAYRQVGKPYQWGGAGPRTYDCSGLVMAAWRKGGLRLPHRADLQHRMIHRKVGLKHLRPGDLVFFSGDHHVGIYVGRHHFLHAPHTGARVQRGTLSGWRLRVFAGAARPGAPAYHAWPHWVRTLAKQHEAEQHPHGAPHRRHDDARTSGPQAETPGTGPVEDAPATDPVQQEVQGPEDDQTGPYTEAVQPPASPVASQPADERPQEPAAYAPPAGSGLLSIPLLRMSAPRGHHHDDPAPRPRTQPDAHTGPHTGPHAGTHTGSRPHRARTSVRRQNDEQRFDRDFGDGGDTGDYGDNDDGAAGNDGIDLRSLLGDAP
ncbi:C40 family peptidase [Actinoallomurus acaciae]|uniref:NlpC/P60 family protein n=1 Tax=Actinoallomurus acaciae TaxID=502577 RepID=A0ABV5YCN5_9ACTN